MTSKWSCYETEFEASNSDTSDTDTDSDSDYESYYPRSRHSEQIRPPSPMKPLEFDGKTNWTHFEQIFLKYSERSGFSSKQKRDALSCCLKGRAKQFYKRLCEDKEKPSYQYLMSQLRKRFKGEELAETLNLEFGYARQEADEKLHHWAQRLLKLGEKGFVGSKPLHTNEFIIRKFCGACKYPEARYTAICQKPRTLDEAIEAIRFIRICDKGYLSDFTDDDVEDEEKQQKREDEMRKKDEKKKKDEMRKKNEKKKKDEKQQKREEAKRNKKKQKDKKKQRKKIEIKSLTDIASDNTGISEVREVTFCQQKGDEDDKKNILIAEAKKIDMLTLSQDELLAPGKMDMSCVRKISQGFAGNKSTQVTVVMKMNLQYKDQIVNELFDNISDLQIKSLERIAVVNLLDHTYPPTVCKRNQIAFLFDSIGCATKMKTVRTYHDKAVSHEDQDPLPQLPRGPFKQAMPCTGPISDCRDGSSHERLTLTLKLPFSAFRQALPYNPVSVSLLSPGDHPDKAAVEGTPHNVKGDNPYSLAKIESIIVSEDVIETELKVGFEPLVTNDAEASIQPCVSLPIDSIGSHVLRDTMCTVHPPKRVNNDICSYIAIDSSTVSDEAFQTAEPYNDGWKGEMKLLSKDEVEEISQHNVPFQGFNVLGDAPTKFSGVPDSRLTSQRYQSSTISPVDEPVPVTPLCTGIKPCDTDNHGDEQNRNWDPGGALVSLGSNPQI